MAENSFQIELHQQQDFVFQVDFQQPGVAPLLTDEPAPLGKGQGPNPSRLLAAAVANCLSASLLFALRKFGNEPGPMRTAASVELARNERGRLRVGRIAVQIHLGVAWGELKHADRALAQFEEFCVVTQSVREGIEVTVQVFDGRGEAAPEANDTTVLSA